jgi:hypothetical protein
MVKIDPVLSRAVFKQPPFLLRTGRSLAALFCSGQILFFSTFLWTGARFPHTLCVNASLKFPERNSSSLFQKSIFFWYTIKQHEAEDSRRQNRAAGRAQHRADVNK